MNRAQSSLHSPVPPGGAAFVTPLPWARQTAEHVEPLFSRPLLPTANADDVGFTCVAAFPRIAAVGGRASAVHVIEKAGGVPDKTGVEQREEVANKLSDVARRAADDVDIDLHTDFRFVTDIGNAILEVTTEVDVTVIVFTPCDGHSWWDLFSGAVRDQLARHSGRPAVVLPTGADNDGDAGGET